MRLTFLLGGFAILWGGLASPTQGWAGTLSGAVQVVLKNGQPAPNNSGVVVYLKEVKGNKGFSSSKGLPSMASQDMQFMPGVLPILVGTSVVFPNKDDALHNAFSVSDPKKFDLGRYGFGEENQVHFDKPGLVNVFCKIHPNMAGYILVLENPYFATTDEDGRYSIKDVPPGNYQVECWFPFGDSQEKKVDLNQTTVNADFKLVKLRNSNSRKEAMRKNRTQKD